MEQKRVISKVTVHIDSDGAYPAMSFLPLPVEIVITGNSQEEIDRKSLKLRRDMRKNLVIMLAEFKDLTPKTDENGLKQALEYSGV